MLRLCIALARPHYLLRAACSICLSPAVEPLACPKGHVFCKGCIYECLLTQKEHKRKQMKKYEEQLKELKV